MRQALIISREAGFSSVPPLESRTTNGFLIAGIVLREILILSVLATLLWNCPYSCAESVPLGASDQGMLQLAPVESY